MSEVFAKLFDTPHGQLLVYRDFNTEEDEDQVVTIGAAVNGVIPRTHAGYDSPEAADAGFAKVDQALADNVAKSLHDFVASLSRGEAA